MTPMKHVGQIFHAVLKTPLTNQTALQLNLTIGKSPQYVGS